MARRAHSGLGSRWAIITSLALVFVAIAVRHPAASPPEGPAETWTVFDRPGQFITALCAADDTLWIGTEDKGLWRLDLSADPAKPDAWKQFTGKDGPNTEHVYAIAVDAAGRVWVGTLNQGVSVYNGREWRTYGVLDGCAGERVFALAADRTPKRGHVWIGTDQGLVCWSPDTTERGAWRTYTRADGLPSDQIYALAVDPRSGRVWVGTECDGLASADLPYDKWTCVRAQAERSGDEGQARGVGVLYRPHGPLPTAPGLPSNLSNDLLILPNGTVVYATKYGLGIGAEGGRRWTAWQGLSKEPFENYLRGLAADARGGLWLATRHLGLARLDLATGAVRTYRTSRPEEDAPPPPPSLPDDYVFDVAVTADGDVWAATYGGGLARLRGVLPPKSADSRSVVSVNPQSEIQNPQSCPSLPAPAGPPSLDELNAMLADLAKVPFVPPERQPPVVRLDDDWLTKGDWLGRCGRYWACLCAFVSPQDYYYGTSEEAVKYTAMIGPQCEQYDSIRYWIHWLYTQNPNTLEMPTSYLDSRVQRGLTTWAVNRRQAEWDDHGEAYPMSKDGPQLFMTFEVPKGEFYLSLYFFNKDGHTGNNRFRDYAICVKGGKFSEVGYADTPTDEDLAQFHRLPTVARARVRDFWGGVYKRFYVRGPQWYSLRIARNHSFNAILSAFMLDPVEYGVGGQIHGVEDGTPSRKDVVAAQTVLRDEYARRRADFLKRFTPAVSVEEAVERLASELDWAMLRNEAWWVENSGPFYTALARWYRARLDPALAKDSQALMTARLASCYYRLGLYRPWEQGLRLLDITTPRAIHRSRRWNAEKGRTYTIKPQEE
ncbi:MAG: two-component regulator propeller domain-containing protein [Phycisphaerae bacterium]